MESQGREIKKAKEGREKTSETKAAPHFNRQAHGGRGEENNRSI